MVPPQVSPISQASSSPRSMERSFGRDPARTSSASAITSASTQPPIVTEPRMRPPSPTHIFAPSFRGVVPWVLTRVARAARPSTCFRESI
jgi:hypothetical protein